MDSAQAERALQVLRGRSGQRTEVTLSSGRQIVVWNVAWGRDEGDEFDHLTTNISPEPAEPHEVDFIFSSEISTIMDPVTRETLFEGPPGLRVLTSGDQAIVRQCLEYVLHSGALSGEFETRMGVTELHRDRGQIIEGLSEQAKALPPMYTDWAMPPFEIDREMS